MTAQTRLIRNWMAHVLPDHVDRTCNEVNTTSLAEDAASEFELWEDDDHATIPEWVFEMSYEVAQAWERGRT